MTLLEYGCTWVPRSWHVTLWHYVHTGGRYPGYPNTWVPGTRRFWPLTLALPLSAYAYESWHHTDTLHCKCMCISGPCPRQPKAMESSSYPGTRVPRPMHTAEEFQCCCFWRLNNIFKTKKLSCIIILKRLHVSSKHFFKFLCQKTNRYWIFQASFACPEFSAAGTDTRCNRSGTWYRLAKVGEKIWSIFLILILVLQTILGSTSDKSWREKKSWHRHSDHGCHFLLPPWINVPPRVPGYPGTPRTSHDIGQGIWAACLHAEETRYPGSRYARCKSFQNCFSMCIRQNAT